MHSLPLRTVLLVLVSLTTTLAPALALDLPLSAIPQRVRAHHPDLAAARLAIAEARGRQLGSGRLANPTVGYDIQSQSRVSPQTAVFSIDQAFPLTRRLSLEKKLTSQLVISAELEVRDAERRLIADAQDKAIRLLTLARQRELRQQQTQLAQKLADFATGRAKAGEVSPLDAKQIHLDAQRLRVEARLLEAQSVSLLGQLKPMLGLRSEDSLVISGDLSVMTLPGISSWKMRPDYQLAQTKIAAAQTDQQLARAKRLPDVKAGFFTSNEFQDVSPSNRVHTGFTGFRISLPLPFWNRNQGEIAEKAAAAERAERESDALALQINGEAGTARREMETNASIVHETRDTLLPLANEQMTAMQKAYESGQAPLLSVLRARDQRLQLESSSLDATRDFHLARIRYESALGTHAPAAPPAHQ
jgi:cobalt-zinc-cadmium efflux system outer membrane protein